ncbi:MAG: T9SS type A sorting domain-containing protein [Ignavibacteriae bacterium]|nr:T9SS type A sorting domain-containing protein [Ignavibacteriota bacterium]
MYSLDTIRVFIVAAAFLLPLASSAQDAGQALPERDGSAQYPSKAEARREYFHTRVTYPGGSVPVGARARAFEQAHSTMRLFAPDAKHGLQAAYEWRNIGPFNIGGRILAVALNPKNPNTILIGAADGGVWRSFDEGRTWHSVSDDWPVQAMGAIAFDPVDTTIVYAGTGEANFGQHMFDGGGLMKSSDGGTTWTEVAGSALPRYARASDIAIDPSTPRTLYLAIPDGVEPQEEGMYKSTDGGATWTLILTGRMTDIVLDPRNPSVLYTASTALGVGGASARYGLHKSVDGGATWTKLSLPGVVDSLMGRTAIAISESNPDILYVSVSRLSGSGAPGTLGVFKTTDAGATWQRCPVPIDYLLLQGWYDNIIGVHPANPNLLYVGGVKMLRSGDGGATWTRVPDQGMGGLLHVDHHAIAFHPTDPDRVYIGNDGGFYVLTDAGATVYKRDLGLSITQFIGGATHPSTDAYALGGTQDNGSMTSGGDVAAWDPVLYGDGGNGAVNPQKPNVVYTTMESIKLWRSGNFGKTWVQALGGMPLHQSLFYIDYAMDPSNPSTLYLGSYRMYKTTNEGRQWNQLRDCLFPTGTSCYYVSAVSVAEYDSRWVFAGATGGPIAKSSDAGATWTVVQDSLPAAYCSAVKSFEPGTVYATYSRYGVDKVWRSTDYGNTWRSIGRGLPDIPANDIIRLDGNLILATDIGTFISVNEGADWQRFGSGMPAVSVQKLRYNKTTGTLRAITHGRGMYDVTWTTPVPAAPVFVSRPDTSVLSQKQPFLYAPVTSGSPAATFTLEEGPQGATIDARLGVVRWTASDLTARFTIKAVNTHGSATQVFTLRTSDVALADWEIVRREAMSTKVNTLRYAGESTLWLTRDSALVSRSLDGGATWEDTRLPGSRTRVVGIHAFDRDRALVGTRSGQIFKTTNGGAQWREVLFRLNAFIDNIWFWDDNNGIAMSYGYRDSSDVFFTQDGGETWTASPQRSFRQTSLFNTWPSSMVFFDRNIGWVAMSNEDNSPSANASVLRTNDGGQTWTAVNAGTRSVSGISFLSALKGYCVDPLSYLTRRSVNGGASWSSTFYPLNGLRAASVFCDVSRYVVWIVTDTSAWASRNEGGVWTRTQMVPAGPIQHAAFAPDGRAWAVTREGIVQRIVNNPMSTERVIQPGEMTLGVTYPNPVTGADQGMTIPFTLARRARLSLTVCNAAGKTVATIADGEFEAGEHMATWDTSSLISGVYFATLVAGDSRLVTRFVVAR